MMEKTFLRRMHLFTTIHMWSFHSSFESRISPRKFTLGPFGMRWPFINSRGSSRRLVGSYSRVNETVEYFDAENFNFHLQPHLDTFSM